MHSLPRVCTLMLSIFVATFTAIHLLAAQCQPCGISHMVEGCVMLVFCALFSELTIAKTKNTSSNINATGKGYIILCKNMWCLEELLGCGIFHFWILLAILSYIQEDIHDPFTGKWQGFQGMSLTLGAHAQWGLRYLVRYFVCPSVHVSVTTFSIATRNCTTKEW